MIQQNLVEFNTLDIFDAADSISNNGTIMGISCINAINVIIYIYIMNNVVSW